MLNYTFEFFGLFLDSNNDLKSELLSLELQKTLFSWQEQKYAFNESNDLDLICLQFFPRGTKSACNYR